MEKENHQVGDLVVVLDGDWKVYPGVVSWPVDADSPGYILVYSDGHIAGLQASTEDVRSADRSEAGFTQLIYYLIKLLSHLIVNPMM
jgi:hypothetical protein